MSQTLRLLWLDLTRFDQKPDKSTWLEMAAELNKHGIQTTIVTSFAVQPFVSHEHKIDFVHVKGSRLPMLFRFSVMWRAYTRIWRIRDENPIVVLAPNALYLAPLLRLAGIRRIHLDARTVPVTIRGLKRRLDVLLNWYLTMRLFSRFVTSFSFITERLRKVVEETARMKPANYCVWSSGVRMQTFAQARRHQVEADGSYCFFYHGTITKDRGIFDLIRGVALTEPGLRSKIKLTIVGAGPDVPVLQELISEVNADGCLVEFLGFKPYESIPPVLREADCCVCPLPEKGEWVVSSPLKIFEYAAAEKPMIMTPIAAHTDVFADAKFVIWTENATAAAFAAAIRKAHEQRVALAEHSRSASAYVEEKYSWEALGRSFSNYLLERYGT